MTKIKAVIFDMDGTLLDSRELIYTAFEDVLADHGIKASRDEIAKVTGRPIKAMYGMLAPHLDSDELELAHLAHHEQKLSTLRLYPDTVTVLRRIKAHGLELGIFTGFNQLTYERLNRFHLVPMFETIVDSTRYTAHKPDPEGIYVAMNDLNITNPKEIIYVGDGVADMEVGKAAGVSLTVGITHGFSSEEMLKEAGADVVIHSLLQLIPIVEKYS